MCWVGSMVAREHGGEGAWWLSQFLGKGSSAPPPPVGQRRDSRDSRDSRASTAGRASTGRNCGAQRRMRLAVTPTRRRGWKCAAQPISPRSGLSLALLAALFRGQMAEQLDFAATANPSMARVGGEGDCAQPKARCAELHVGFEGGPAERSRCWRWSAVVRGPHSRCPSARYRRGIRTRPCRHPCAG